MERKRQQIQCKEFTRERIRYDKKSIEIIQTRPLEYGLVWTLLRNIIIGFSLNTYSKPIKLEYHEGQAGFRKWRGCSFMTDFIMTLSSVNHTWRNVLKSKCVFRELEWDFIPGSIDPPETQPEVYRKGVV